MSILWKKSSWNRHRMVVLLFVLLCLFVTGIRRQNFKGEETETSIGWDLTNGPMENLELDEATELTQVFYAQDGILDLIYIGINGHGQTGSMIVTVRDANGKEIAVRELPCNTMIDQGAQGIAQGCPVLLQKHFTDILKIHGLYIQAAVSAAPFADQAGIHRKPARQACRGKPQPVHKITQGGQLLLCHGRSPSNH